MREIKFRVWNNKTKKWVHGPDEEVNLFGECILLGGFMRGIGIMELNDCVPLQYTGLGNVYEGDIVKQIDAKFPDNTFVGVVQYDIPNAAFLIRSNEGRQTGLGSAEVYCEVIGNVFETKKEYEQRNKI